MDQAAKAADELYLLRDTYFPLDPNHKIAALQSQSHLALNLLDSIPSGQFYINYTSLTAQLQLNLLILYHLSYAFCIDCEVLCDMFYEASLIKVVFTRVLS